MRETNPADGAQTILVLLAEDEASVRGLVQKILERAGYTVLVAEDGERAWDAAGRQPGRLSLLVTDVVMPRMFGTELADRITDLRPDLPVLFMSGYTDSERLRGGILDPCQAFLEKPFTPHQLLEHVRTLLDCARVRQGEREDAEEGEAGEVEPESVQPDQIEAEGAEPGRADEGLTGATS